MVINPELLNYINKQIASGEKVEKIKESLLAVGWKVADIDDAIKQINKISNEVPFSLAKSSINNKKFVFSGLFICLIVAGVAVGYFYTKSTNTAYLPSPSYTPTPSPTQIVTFELKSSFLKNESIAQQIASGELKTYDIKKYGFIYGATKPDANVEDFAYRFFNAIKMTGQIIGANTVGGHYASEDLLNRFQQFWGFPVSSDIDVRTLQKVDSLLASREANEEKLALTLPIYSHFIDTPKNQETKIHSAYLFAKTFKELPPGLVVWSEQNFKDYFARQLGGHYDRINSSDYKICDVYLYDNFGDNCKPITGHPKAADDFDTMSVKIHEYAHYLDRNLYPRNEKTSQGLIDTTGFYNISYDVSQRDTTAEWPSYKLRNLGNERNEFVGAYAIGWSTSKPGYKSSPEDFAESFHMYIAQGKLFRVISSNNSVLKQKYDWLKQNVFNGVEYQSGAADALEYTKDNPNKVSVATGAFNVRDFSEYYPNFVWNYGFLNGSMESKP